MQQNQLSILHNVVLVQVKVLAFLETVALLGRRFALQAMKDLLLKNGTLETIVTEEALALCDHLRNLNGDIIHNVRSVVAPVQSVIMHVKLVCLCIKQLFFLLASYLAILLFQRGVLPRISQFHLAFDGQRKI